MIRKLESHLANRALIEADDRNLVSRTEGRREKQRLEAERLALATKLTTFKKRLLERLDLSDSVLAILDEIRVIESAPARTRALKRLRGELRDADLELLTRRIAALADPSAPRPANPETTWRDRLTSDGDTALTTFVEQFPWADRAQLRALVRNWARSNGSDRTRASAKLVLALRVAMRNDRGALDVTLNRAGEEV